MLKTEMKTRQTSLLDWIKNPANKTNPNLNNVCKYWLKLSALIAGVKVENIEVIDTPAKHPDLVESTPEIRNIEVIEPITIN